MTTARTNGPKWLAATRPYRLAWAKAALPCALCRRPIDYSLHRSHRESLTVDHLVPLMLDGSMFDPTNWQPAHRSCNASKGVKDRNARDAAANEPTRWRW
ncbi:MAG: HNH endonuclease [Acidimicrobiia bacterium]|nr:HNH endonuclease [Acidimicrobiia bacterium]